MQGGELCPQGLLHTPCLIELDLERFVVSRGGDQLTVNSVVRHPGVTVSITEAIWRSDYCVWPWDHLRQGVRGANERAGSKIAHMEQR